jgi:hypothetical protein
MTIKPKSFTKSYTYGPFLQYKLEAEISFEDGEDFDTGFNKAQEMCDAWHKKNEAAVWANPEGMTGIHTRTVDSSEVDEAYNKLVNALDTFEFREDAQAYLDTTDFKYAMAAKNLVSKKPSKNI